MVNNISMTLEGVASALKLCRAIAIPDMYCATTRASKKAAGTHLWGRISRIWLMSMTLGKAGNPAARKHEAVRNLSETQSAGGARTGREEHGKGGGRKGPTFLDGDRLRRRLHAVAVGGAARREDEAARGRDGRGARAAGQGQGQGARDRDRRRGAADGSGSGHGGGLHCARRGGGRQGARGERGRGDSRRGGWR